MGRQRLSRARPGNRGGDRALLCCRTGPGRRGRLDPETGAAMAAEFQAADGDALFVPTDVTDSVSVAAMHDATRATFGTPDILVNNAGINVFRDPLAISDQDRDRCMSVDLEGVWRCTRAFLPGMIEACRGIDREYRLAHAFQIIPGCFPYPVAKHAVVGLTRALAIEYAARGIRVNAIAPGYIETPIATEIGTRFRTRNWKGNAPTNCIRRSVSGVLRKWAGPPFSWPPTRRPSLMPPPSSSTAAGRSSITNDMNSSGRNGRSSREEK